MRKFLLITMMCLFGLFTMNAQETSVDPEDLYIVEIGADKNPTASYDSYTPVYDYAKYSMSQQIYTAEEMAGNVGKIYSVAFKLGTKEWLKQDNMKFISLQQNLVHLKETISLL